MIYQEPDSDIIERIQDKMDQVIFDEVRHHHYCPNANWHHPFRDSECRCSELIKGDREAAAEDRWEDDYKYGGM